VSEPVTDVKIVDNVFVKMFKFLREGDTHSGHAHVFDHITLLSIGSVRMLHDNGEQVYVAPHLIVTPKGIAHQFIALEAGTTICCIHAIRDGDTVDSVAKQDITEEEAFDLLTTYDLILPIE
jgi:quercetin dioxygenase-like cupin family protein